MTYLTDRVENRERHDAKETKAVKRRMSGKGGRMNKMVYRAVLFLFVLTGVTCLNSVSYAQQEAPMMTKEALKPLIGNPDITIMDLRFGREWYGSDVKIKGAVREDPLKPGQWMDKYPKDKMLVLYCA